MSATWGQALRLTIFGESHGPAIGVVLDGLPPGLVLDWNKITEEMDRRAPGRSPLATARREQDMPRVVSGFFEGKTTGGPLCAMLENTDTHSSDYRELRTVMRPGHADYTGQVRYHGCNDYRGGGGFSGRLTAPLVFAGAVCKQLLAGEGVRIAAHLAAIGGVKDGRLGLVPPNDRQLEELANSPLPVLHPACRPDMEQAILQAKQEGDSVGGVIECGAFGLPAGWGDPFFDSVESTLSHLLFSIPAVKGVEFGAGFELAEKMGSQANDPFLWRDGRVQTETNCNGGVLGGITTGMPLIVRAAVKPTPSIAKPQRTVNLETGREETLAIKGRHDPCIAPRAVPVVEAAVAIGLCEHWLRQGGIHNG